MTDADDRKLIADVLEHDQRATPGPWTAENLSMNGDDLDCWQVGEPLTIPSSDGDYLSGTNAESIAAYRTAAPELARRLAALLDALDDTAHLEASMMEAFHHDDIGADMANSIRAAYARNLAKGSKP